MQRKSGKILFGGILVFLICYFIRFCDIPNLVTVPIGAILCLILLIKQKKIRLDLETCLLMLTLGIYFVKDIGFIKAVISPYCYVAPVIFILAHYLAYEIKDQENYEKLFVLLILVMSVGVTIHGILNSYMFLDGQILEQNIRVWKDFWSSEFIYGTMQVAFFFSAFAMTFPSIIYWRKAKILSTFFLSSTTLFILIAILSQTRMPVIILPIVFVVQLIVYVLMEKQKVKEYFTKKRFLTLGTILFIAIICVGVILCKTSAGQGFIRAMSRDGGIFNNIRFKIQRSALEQLFLYPMGGNQMDHLGYGHTHNAWLDVADIGGLIPFFAFVMYTFLTGYEVIKFTVKKTISSGTKLIVVGLYLVYFIFFTIEPSLDWSVHFMIPWIFVHGLVHGYVKD